MVSIRPFVKNTAFVGTVGCVGLVDFRPLGVLRV